MMKKYLMMLLMTLFCAVSSQAAVTITGQGGWFESAYVTWQKTAGLEYNVYVSPASSDSWVKLDNELVREYPSYGRADVLGLKAGSYKFKVVPVQNAEEKTGDASISSSVEVKAHDRSGFAHKQAGNTGIGAYNNDGTLKEGAHVVYVTANNAKTVSLDIATSSNGKTATYTGLQQIIYGYQKGDNNGSYEKAPLCIRIIGTIKDTDMDKFLSSKEGIQIKGAKAYQKMNITIEGVGNDATVWGFGFLIRSASMIELRNFGIMWCMDDAVSIDTNNSMIWVHNLDLFYGKPGGDADQAKGDGTIDMKGDSQYLTISYNHLWDSGKASLCGMKSESGPNWITYHHNWFDHSDSRHPRIRTMSVHVYNNYFDGNAKYGVGAAYQSNAFVESNYFRNCKYPMLISMQGSDMDGGKGTFSSEDGGVIKSYGNFVKGAKNVVTYQQNQTEFDCWEATNRDAQVPAEVKAKQGGKTYSNFDTNSSIMYSYTPDAAEQIPSIIRGTYGAGRMQHGDFKWTFNNSVQDANYGVISELTSAINNYVSTLVGFFDGEVVKNGGATATVDAGDGKGIDQATNDAAEPNWGGGGGSATVVTAGKYVIGTKDDYFWFNEANEEAYNNYVAAHNFATTGTFNATQEITNSKIGSCSDYIGSVRLAENGTFTAYYADGIVGASFYVSSNGTQKWILEKSTDGNSWEAAGTVEGSTGGHPACVVTASNDEAIKYVRITNKANSSRDIQGIKIATFDPDADPEVDGGDDEPTDTRSSDATAEFTLNDEEIVMSGSSYTLNVNYDAADAAGYAVTVIPADNATIAKVTGAEGSGSNYTISAPSAGTTATATFRILAENQANTKTYTINIVKGVDPSTVPVTTGEFTYFSNGTTNNDFFTISGNTTANYGTGSYVHNGENYNCSKALKMESKTTIMFTPTQDGILKVGFTSSGAQNLKLNGEKVEGTDGVLTVEVKANTVYTITKAETAYVLYIDLVYGESGGQGGGETPQPTAESIFSASVVNKQASDVKVASGTSLDMSTYATITGGTMTFYNNNSSDFSAVIQSNKLYMRIGSNDHYYKIVLTQALAVGDMISYSTTDNYELSFTNTYTRSTTPATSSHKYTVTEGDGLAGQTTVYVWRVASSTTVFNDLKITRPTSTGISMQKIVDVSDGAVYDLMGRRVSQPEKGKLYIQNGKKYIAK